MENETLTPEQIENWRRIIYMQLEDKFPGAGAYAIIMPEAEIIAFWKKTKALFESEPITEPQPRTEPKPQPRSVVEYHESRKCKHTNTITGQNGDYCLDCEKYI